ncbi:CocE/NonD family hydrolase [Rhodococcus erythropolis]|uniref:CocE/NonD family hydrolase n=1 Tax=Rhodococcus erythropolis TaxID=1833 RepID=UPI0022B40585|nr:CocE/NonD family hydrolase [Rhodococcus erythropolis]MCZ4526913.1 CocE/NonD family hydrolase [Rhodococcus erythropolis]
MISLGVTIPAADGSSLATDVLLPPESSPRGLIVIRTPYGRGWHLAEGIEWRSRGIAFICQDVRGRHDSAGSWEPYVHEREDAAALAEWLQDQPWTPNCVIASGASYAAGTAWAFTAETNSADRPFHVGGVVSKVPTIGSDRVKRDPSGILLLAEHLAWWGEHGDSASSREGFIPALMRSNSSLLEHLPVQSMIEKVGLTCDSPGWVTPISRARERELYGSDDLVSADELSELDVAGLHIGGWDDAMIRETLRHFASVGRGPQSLIVGPWAHDLRPGMVGETSFGGLQVEWMESIFSARPLTVNRVFDRGVGEWSTEPYVTGANRVRLEPDLAREPYSFWYDAADNRNDCVVSTFDMQLECVLSGTPSVELNVHSPEGEADWIVELSVVDTAGVTRSIARGAGVSLRSGTQTIDLDPVLHTVRPGDVLSLRISGADFPRLARNLGDGDRYRGTRSIALHQSFSGSLTLPMLGGTDDE